jgi:hypothetical protein
MNTPDPKSAPRPTGVGAAVAQSLAGTTPPPTQVTAQEDPRARAARRAAELREHMGGNMDDGVDKFYIDPRVIPDGWSYEWKRFAVLGKEDPSYHVSLAHRGWEAVPRSRHPEMMPDNYRGETIEREGQLLMERPKEITDEVNAIEKRKAREQVSSKEQQLNGAPAGQFERDAHPQTRATIKKSYESIPIPDK